VSVPPKVIINSHTRVLCMVYLLQDLTTDNEDLPLWMRMMLHLDGLKRIPHFTAQLSSASRSLWKINWSSSVHISRYAKQSSANNRVVVPGEV